MVFGVEQRKPRPPKKGAVPEGRPSGAFGQEFPQNVPSAPHSAAVLDQGVVPLGLQPEGERVDADGLPYVGAVVWPGQSYYTTINKTNGAVHGLLLITAETELRGVPECMAPCCAVEGDSSLGFSAEGLYSWLEYFLYLV